MLKCTQIVYTITNCTSITRCWNEFICRLISSSALHSIQRDKACLMNCLLHSFYCALAGLIPYFISSNVFFSVQCNESFQFFVFINSMSRILGSSESTVLLNQWTKEMQLLQIRIYFMTNITKGKGALHSSSDFCLRLWVIIFIACDTRTGRKVSEN